MSEPTRKYVRQELTVEWRPELCSHCHNCITDLPAVFNLEKRPWVDVSAAAADEIRDQVLKCPSGALSITPKEP